MSVSSGRDVMRQEQLAKWWRPQTLVASLYHVFFFFMSPQFITLKYLWLLISDIICKNYPGPGIHYVIVIAGVALTKYFLWLTELLLFFF